MKKISSLLLCMFALAATVVFTACSKSDDDKAPQSNYEKYQQEVNSAVEKAKKHDNVILLVAFGSTWQQSFETFDKIKEEYQREFGNEWDVFLAFSSAICINNASSGVHEYEDTEIRDYFDPEHWLTAFGKNAYKQIVVQSLQVIPGEEYRRVRDSYVKDFMNNKNRDFTADYMHSIDKMVAVGTPLLAEEEDVDILAGVLREESDVKFAENQGCVVFMGHGNPENYDYYGANIRYTQLEKALNDGLAQKKYFVGTVDMPDNYCEDVLWRMEEAEVAEGSKVQLYPLMSISGDHAHNDMADEEDEESWVSLFTEAGYEAQAYETNFKEACKKGYKEGEPYIPALAERSAVRKLWINHTKEAIQAIKDGRGLSTPTTEPEEEEE